jgi:hypothetical protein
MKSMYLSSTHIKILFEEFNKVFDKSYKFTSINGNKIKIYTVWTLLECNFFLNEKGKIVVILSNNWCVTDINLLTTCITNAYKWEYMPSKPSCFMSNFCYFCCPLCYVKTANNYNSKLIFEM